MDLLPCSCPVPACLHFNRISSALWIVVGGAVSGKRLIHLKHKTPLLLASEEDAIVHLKKIKQASLFFGLPSSVSYAASMPAEEAGTWPGQEAFLLCGELCGLYSPFRLYTISVAAHWWEISLSCVACWLKWTMKCSFFSSSLELGIDALPLCIYQPVRNDLISPANMYMPGQTSSAEDQSII